MQSPPLAACSGLAATSSSTAAELALVVTARSLGGLLSALVEIRFSKQTEDGVVFLRYGVLPGELARAFVAYPRVWSRLPRLLLYCRSPLFDVQWGFAGQSGYHPESCIFYDGPDVVPTSSGTPLLDCALADFHWRADADRVGVIGVLLTALTMPHWGRGHPFLAINGNRPGVGKTTLARVIGVIVERTEPSCVSYIPGDTEFERQLATRVEAGDRVINNAKTRRAIASAVLERCITSSRLNFRRLGSNSSITRPQNDVLFCLTMNLAQLGPDPHQLSFVREMSGNSGRGHRTAEISFSHMTGNHACRPRPSTSTTRCWTAAEAHNPKSVVPSTEGGRRSYASMLQIELTRNVLKLLQIICETTYK